MYCVLEFDGEDKNQTAVVRSEWLTPKKSEVFWPPFKMSSKFNRALLEGTAPDETWSLYPVRRCLYFNDDLLKARSKEREAEEQSDIQTDGAEEGNKKRKIRPVIYSSDEECPTARKQLKSDNKLKSSKSFEYPTFIPTEEIEIPDCSSELPSRANVTPSPPRSSLKLSKNESTTNLVQEVLPEIPALSAKPKQKEVISSTVLKLLRGQRQLEAHMGDLIEKMYEMNEKLNKILDQGLPSQTETEVDEPLLSIFPIQTHEDFVTLEKKLVEVPPLKSKLIKLLMSVGGSESVKTMTINIMRRTLTDDIAQLFSFTGKKGYKEEKKEAFCSTHLFNSIQMALRKGLKERFSEDHVKKHITMWLNQAKTRQTRRKGVQL